MRSQSTALEKLLGGWQLNGLLQLNSGYPLTAVLSSEDVTRNFDEGTPGRPQLVAGFDTNPFLGLQDEWVDEFAFDFPEPGFFGDVGRTTMQGPGYASLDLAVVKNTQITETVNLQFRFEGFNVLNKANFGRIRNVVFKSKNRRRGDFGFVRETKGTERQLQIAMKIIF